MAQRVGYFDDNVTFEEGPFVITNPLGNGWRIEAQIMGSGTPALPDSSVYDLLRKVGHSAGKWNDLEPAAEACDFLNEQVKAGKICMRPSGGWLVP